MGIVNSQSPRYSQAAPILGNDGDSDNAMDVGYRAAEQKGRVHVGEEEDASCQGNNTHTQ